MQFLSAWAQHRLAASRVRVCLVVAARFAYCMLYSDCRYVLLLLTEDSQRNMHSPAGVWMLLSLVSFKQEPDGWSSAGQSVGADDANDAWRGCGQGLRPS